jgi:SET domain-containing protein
MCTSFTNDNVYVKKSKYKGRGVFASRKIYMGEEIEACPILLELKNRIPANNVLTDYVFSTGIEGEVAFAMGYCGLFNHDDNNNARWFINRDTRTVTIIALKDIKKDEEIFVSYGDKYWATRNIKKD